MVPENKKLGHTVFGIGNPVTMKNAKEFCLPTDSPLHDLSLCRPGEGSRLV
jgi:hypothetical protein